MEEQGHEQLPSLTPFARLRQRTTRTADTVARYFERFWDIWTILKLCRFNVLLPAVVGVFLTVGPNGQDILLRMLQDAPQSPSMMVAFLVALTIWGLTVWYWARVILAFRFRNWPPRLTVEDASNAEARQAHAERMERILFWHAQVPRICGVGAMAVIAWALFTTSREMTEDLGGWWKSSVWAFGVMASIGFFIWNRRRAIRFLFGGLLGQASEEDRQNPLSFFYAGKDDTKFYETFRALPSSTVLMLVLSLVALSIGPFLIIVNREWNLMLAPHLGPPTILLLAASAWIPAGAILMYWSNHYRVPVFAILALYVAWISAYNDNHRVRDLAVDRHPRMTVEQQLGAWIEQRKAEISPHRVGGKDPVTIPIFIVAAEGGGIRAAYWTATLLARMQKEQPNFSEHVFAISGVSGGSLGAAVFNALLVEQKGTGACQSRMVECAHDILSKDFVAPTLATMLYPDLTQRFLPISTQKLCWDWDRATTLEAAWEKAWKDVTGNDRFGTPIENLWAQDAQEQKVPHLFLNSTSVERGNRVMTSNLDISNIDKPFTHCPETVPGTKGVFHDITDFNALLNACPGKGTDQKIRTVRLSTAAHNSARFTYVSPAGTIASNLHIVDGGYFENSGATTGMELIKIIKRKNKQLKEENEHGKGTTHRIELLPMVIHIANEPEAIVVAGTVISPLKDGRIELKPDADGESSLVSAGESLAVFVDENRIRVGVEAGALKQGARVILELDRADNIVRIVDTNERHFLPETLSPIWALLNTRDARATYAVDVVRTSVEPDRNSPKNFFHFGLKKSPVHPPLGWTLSSSSTREMDWQRDAYFLGCKKEDEQGKPYRLEEYFRKCWP